MDVKGTSLPSGIINLTFAQQDEIIKLHEEVASLKEDIKELREAQKYNFRVIDRHLNRLEYQIHRGFTHILK